MNHPYQTYIETKAEDYYSRQAHEPHCETLQPYRPTRNERTGETYDVYITQHCDCWLTVNFDALTLERKFQAMRALSHRYGMHSPACSRLKRTPITYRGRPEIMTGWCDCWLSVDMQPEPEVQYKHSQPTPTKGNTITTEVSLSPLYSAQVLVRNLNDAQDQIEAHLAPYLAKYKELMLELNHHNYDQRDLSVDTFNEIDREYFSFTSEEVYEYGDYYTPTLNLPFAFVEDPEAYAAKERQHEANRKAKTTAKTAKDKQERVERLKTQLAKAQAELDKAEKGDDQIKLAATRNHVESLSR